MNLTRAQMRYLFAIYKLSEQGKGVHSASVAEALQVSGPSVNRMVNNLAHKEILEKEPYGNVFLTKSGEALAKELWQRVEQLNNRLKEALGLPHETAYACALLLLAELPESLWQTKT